MWPVSPDRRRLATPARRALGDLVFLGTGLLFSLGCAPRYAEQERRQTAALDELRDVFLQVRTTIEHRTTRVPQPVLRFGVVRCARSFVDRQAVASVVHVGNVRHLIGEDIGQACLAALL